jgi:hypothetical protein
MIAKQDDQVLLQHLLSTDCWIPSDTRGICQTQQHVCKGVAAHLQSATTQVTHRPAGIVKQPAYHHGFIHNDYTAVQDCKVIIVVQRPRAQRTPAASHVQPKS